MRIVIALGGNALLERGERPDSGVQEQHVVRAVTALTPVLHEHDVVITHGNGPQVGVLALESASDAALSRPYPFDVLGAQTQGMIGYWIMQALSRAVPVKRVGCLICRTIVAADDPAFARPAKFVGPVYDEQTARRLAAGQGWQVRKDGAAWRRVVPSPEPAEIVELSLIRTLADDGAIVVCSGGGGIPVVRDAAGGLRGVEAVIDKDLSAALLARKLRADALLILTDVAAVEDGYGTPAARPIRHATASELRARRFPDGSMGPKVEAACRFAEATGHTAAIGRLDDVPALLAGRVGTVVTRGLAAAAAAPPADRPGWGGQPRSGAPARWALIRPSRANSCARSPGPSGAMMCSLTPRRMRSSSARRRSPSLVMVMTLRRLSAGSAARRTQPPSVRSLRTETRSLL